MSSSSSGSGAYNARSSRAKTFARRARSLARTNVIVRRDGAVFVLTLPVNEGFKAPNVMDRQRGVVYAEYESDAFVPITPMPGPLQVAEMAMAYAARREALPGNLARWTTQAARREGGNVKLAAALVALEPDPKHAKTDQRNMLRKVEEWKQGKYKAAAGRNQRRVAAYVISNARRVSMGVTGQWWLVKRENEEPQGPIYRRFNTQPDKARDRALSVRALLSEGSDFILDTQYAASDQIGAYAVYVEVVHGLHVEVDP